MTQPKRDRTEFKLKKRANNHDQPIFENLTGQQLPRMQAEENAAGLESSRSRLESAKLNLRSFVRQGNPFRMINDMEYMYMVLCKVSAFFEIRSC